MVKPHKLNKGDKIAIVSLSRGLLGMPFCKHELDLGIERLKSFGLEPVIMPNALKDMDYLAQHPEARAEDLKQAFLDDSIKAIMSAIGGNDTYKLIPYLMEDPEFREAVIKHPKIFTGFSDTTNNHLMLNKLGLSTFYGPCLMVDMAELDKEMLPYTKEYFEKYFKEEEKFEIVSSPIWYSDRKSYGREELGKPREVHDEKHHYEVLNGSGVVHGRLYGGCIESLYNAMTSPEAKMIYDKYEIFPTEKEWQDKILFIETSDGIPDPEELRTMLLTFKEKHIFDLVKGVIVGKPLDEKYYDEYKDIYREIFKDINTPLLYNVNFGHSVPRTIIPYDAMTTVDYDQKTIIIDEKIFN